ncbi:thioredoxin [Pseudofulvibacter geojedonensis]|uniref:Thioredoxin n=1 Tax=Pseudofulvibacter geojedonensis TaxID=1123758 RepID=A0ABW3I5X4_9FLAO
MDIQINQDQFIKTVEDNNIVVIDFFADWCGPCQTLLPTIHKLAEELKDEVTIKKVNVDTNRELSVAFNVRSIPTLVYFKNGKEVARHNGLLSEGMLRGHINQLKTA